MESWQKVKAAFKIVGLVVASSTASSFLSGAKETLSNYATYEQNRYREQIEQQLDAEDAEWFRKNF